MESPRIHFVRIAGAVRGPVSVAQLREMAGIAVVAPDTDVAAHADGPWVKLATLAIALEVFPARRAVEFKPTQFEEINRAGPAAMDPAEAIEQALRPPKSFRGREVVVAPLGLRGKRDGEPLSDVQEMVLEVGRRVAAHAPPAAMPRPPPRFRHWPWFAAASVLGTTAILCVPLCYGRKYDAMSVSILGGWGVMFNGLLALLLVTERRMKEMLRSNKSRFDALQ